MQIALTTFLMYLLIGQTFGLDNSGATQLKISKAYQAITELDLSIQEQTQRIKQLKNDITHLSQSMGTLQKKLSTSDSDLKNLTFSCQKALNKMYHLSFSDKSADQVYLNYFSQKVIRQQKKLQHLKKEQEVMIRQQSKEKTEYHTLMNKHAHLNQQLRREKSKIESEITDLQSLLDATLKKAHQNQSMNQTTLSPIIDLKGQLPWPVQGQITQHFGSTLYDSQIKSEAILIQAQDEVIRAVHPGKIIYADWLPSYGYLIIIDHGNHYHTLYGHLDHTTVALNQIVDSGEVIGEIKKNRSNQNDLFFSLKNHLTAQDPEIWLSPSI